MKSIYGNCSCGYHLEPVFFEEQEEKIYKDGFKVKKDVIEKQFHI